MATYLQANLPPVGCYPALPYPALLADELRQLACPVPCSNTAHPYLVLGCRIPPVIIQLQALKRRQVCRWSRPRPPSLSQPAPDLSHPDSTPRGSAPALRSPHPQRRQCSMLKPGPPGERWRWCRQRAARRRLRASGGEGGKTRNELWFVVCWQGSVRAGVRAPGGQRARFTPCFLSAFLAKAPALLPDPPTPPAAVAPTCPSHCPTPRPLLPPVNVN